MNGHQKSIPILEEFFEVMEAKNMSKTIPMLLFGHHVHDRDHKKQ